VKGRDKLEQWQERKQDIWKQIRWLCGLRDTFRLVRSIVERNPHLGQSGSFCRWIFTNYGYSAGIGIRRMLDRSSDAISLARLMLDIAGHPGQLTLARLQTYPHGRREAAEKVFPRYAADCGSCLSPERLTAALAEVEQSASGVMRFVNKVIAHPTAERPTMLFSDVNRPLDAIAALFKDIDILLGGTGDLWLNRLDVAKESDSAFTQPWIRAELGPEGEAL